MNKLEIFNSELLQDLEILKTWLKLSGKITSYSIIREKFCQSIGININHIATDNLINLNDDIFIDTLFDYLSRTDNKICYYKMTSIIEDCFINSLEKVPTIKKIKRNLRLAEILTILKINNFTDSQIFDICNLAYKKCLLHKENKINIDSKNLDKDLNQSVEMLATLNNYQADDDNQFSLLDFFVGYLKMNIINNHNNQFPDFLELLDKWIKNYPNNENELMNIIHQKQPAIDTRNNPVHSLLIAIKDGNNLTIDSWFIEDITTYHNDKNCRKINTNFTQELIKNLTWDNLEHKFPQLLDILLNTITINSTSEIRNIQLFLPYKRIIAVDKFIITREEEKYYLGAYYQINIRLLERITLPTSHDETTYRNRWKDKSNSLKDKIRTSATLIDCFIPLCFLNKDSKGLKNELREDDKLAAISCCAVENHQTENFVKILYFTGIPLALWVRKNINNYEADLCGIISQSQCLNTLSEVIRKKRLEADQQRDRQNDNHIGYDFYFLYDDADLVPHEENFNNKLSIP